MVGEFSGEQEICRAGVAASTGFAHVIHTLLMNYMVLRMIACVSVLLMAGCQAEPYPMATPRRVEAVTAAISPAVVRVDVAQAIYKDGRQSLIRGNGSGVIIDQQGRILTNYHVAGRAIEIYVTLANKERVPARLIGDDHWTDLAVIQMDMDEVRRQKIGFSSAQLGDSAKLVVGQDVMAFGTPFGLARTVTRGSVSNTDRTFYDVQQRMDIEGYETGDFSNWIQMDVPINPGNSGGPLVDINAKVVGINTRGGGQNLNFAIPIDTAKPVIAAILRTAAPGVKGHMDRSDLGFDLMPMHQLESFYDIDINKGVLINSVDRIGPYADAGGKAQDILLAVNGEPTNVRFPEELAAVRRRLAALPIGSDVQLTIKRGKNNLTLTAKTTLLEGYLGEERGFTQWGASLREVTRPYAIANQLDQVAGVWITSMSDGEPVERAHLQPGDVILSVNNTPVKGMAQFQALYDKTLAQKLDRVELEVERDREVFTSILKVKEYAPASEPSD
ncbi:MAG TPA: trypsin-like peptidase domain-containing protein [Tepidisphaeraceae bacterium]|nr:trypsin-like peptidase domain-containing protein [Tepidisphaeraceae bacterium]